MATPARIRLEKFVTILSIDGGGIRGIVPALVVAEIEKRAGALPLSCSTSSPGLRPAESSDSACHWPMRAWPPRFTAADLADFYRQQGPTIFPKESILHNLICEFAGPKYPEHGVEAVLQSRFGLARLSDALTDVMVTSYDIESRHPYHFKSWVAKDNPAHDFLMWQAARATSAAPTFFAPIKVQSLDGSKTHTFIDGGVYANNPAMCAVAEASRLHPIGLVRFVMVSLGTGVLTRPYHYEHARRWGQIEWVRPFLDIVLQAAGTAVDYEISELLGELKDPTRYYRFQGILDEADDNLDNASPDNVKRLEELAARIIQKNDDQINELCGWLKLSLISPVVLRNQDVPPLKTEPG